MLEQLPIPGLWKLRDHGPRQVERECQLKQAKRQLPIAEQHKPDPELNIIHVQDLGPLFYTQAKDHSYPSSKQQN